MHSSLENRWQALPALKCSGVKPVISPDVLDSLGCLNRSFKLCFYGKQGQQLYLMTRGLNVQNNSKQILVWQLASCTLLCFFIYLCDILIREWDQLKYSVFAWSLGCQLFDIFLSCFSFLSGFGKCYRYLLGLFFTWLLIPWTCWFLQAELEEKARSVHRDIVTHVSLLGNYTNFMYLSGTFCIFFMYHHLILAHFIFKIVFQWHILESELSYFKFTY